jgi:hypothetical protein
MAGTKTGTPTIIKLARRICRLKGSWGASDLQAKTTPAFKAAVDALVIACMAFEALDEQPAQIDRVAPYGPEDLPSP